MLWNRAKGLCWALVLGLTACQTVSSSQTPSTRAPLVERSPAPAVSPVPAPESPPPIRGRTGLAWELLRGKHPETKRARFGFAGKVRLLPNGEPIGKETREEVYNLTAKVVQEHPLQLVVEDHGIRLLVFPDPKDLRRVTTKGVPLRLHAGERDPAPHRAMVEVASGTQPTILSERDGWVEVAVEDDEGQATYQGWLPDDELGVLFDEIDFPPVDGTTMRTRGPAALYTQPGAGDRLTQFSESRHLTVVHETASHVLVTNLAACSTLRFSGYIRKDELEESTLGGGGCSRGVFGLLSHKEEAELPIQATLDPGRVLLAPGTREVVGCVTREIGVAVDEDGLHYARTPWGPLGFELASASVRCSDQSNSVAFFEGA